MGSENPPQIPVNQALGPALPAMFTRYKDLVEQELSHAVPQPELPDLSELAVVFKYHLGWVDPTGNPAVTPTAQGKALRPTLCLFACEALAGDLRHAVSAAAALELIHNFSLIHDDIQDQDRERRHQPTVWSLWGMPKALVSGDAMQSLGDLALLSVAGRGVPAATAVQVSRILTESYLEMIEGQCLDLGFESSTSTTTAEYLHMIACKTGALIRSSLEIGAALATDDATTTRAFASFGGYLGRAFQIRDDYLGIWGDQGTTGKSTDSDIRRRKKSFPVVFALERSSGGSREDLLRIYSQETLADADVARVLSILEEVGAPEHADRLTQESAEQARQSLAGVSLPGWARAEVEELVDFLARRQY